MQDIYQQSLRGIHQSLQHPQRPFGVSVMALAIGMYGTFYLILMMIYLFFVNAFGSFLSALVNPGPGSTSLFPKIDVNANAPSIMLTVLYLTFFALAYLGLARGLYLLKRWAYWCLILLEVLNMGAALVQAMNDHNGIVFFTSIWIPLLITLYLLAVGSVRRAFV